jgi:hypothetical protein
MKSRLRARALKVSTVATWHYIKNIPLLLHRDKRYLFKQILTREYAMGIDNNVALQTNTKKLAKSEPSRGIWIGGMAVRAIFIIILTVVTARVASPQVENIWSVFETPGDLIRVALGFAACAWFITHIFVLPKDAEAYRTWLYLGLAVLPLSLLCAFVIW